MYTSTAETLCLNTVPAFLTKLWTLVEDPSTDELICWDASGKSFHVLDQARFAKEILPLYFKHNNIASFIRQLNMYGFRKVVSTEAVNLKMEKDDMEFAHQFFVQGEEHLLEFIKRKVPTSKGGGGSGGSVGSGDESALRGSDMRSVLVEVNAVKGRQDTMTVKLENLKLENEVLWREVASLRQMHMKQQQIVNKLIQFLVSMVGNKRTLSGGVKRKGPLMINSGSASPTPPKVARNRSNDKLYHVQSPQPSPSNSAEKPTSGMVIDDVTELLAATVSPEACSTSDPVMPSSRLGDAMEPLAIIDSEYPPSLELTDVLDGDNGVPIVSFEDVLTPSIDVSTAETIGTTAGAAVAVQTNPLFLTNALAVTDTKPSSDFGRNDITSHLDITHNQINGLRELLTSSPQISIDPNMMFELFDLLDSNPMPSMSMEDDDDELWKKAEDSTSANGSIVGNEIVHYTTPDDFSSLYDAADLIAPYQNIFDSAGFGEGASASSVGDDDVLNELYLSTPRPSVVDVGSRQTKLEKIMEDVD